MKTLPQKTQTEEVLPVPVDIEEPVVTEKEAEDVLRRHGFGVIADHELAELSRLGIYARGLGTLNTQRGRVLVSQQRMDGVLQELYQAMLKARKEKSPARLSTMLARLAQSFGYVQRAMTESQVLALDIDGLGRSRGNHVRHQLAEEDVPLQPGLPPGANVRPGTTLAIGREVHIHNPAPKEVPPC